MVHDGARGALMISMMRDARGTRSSRRARARGRQQNVVVTCCLYVYTWLLRVPERAKNCSTSSWNERERSMALLNYYSKYRHIIIEKKITDGTYFLLSCKCMEMERAGQVRSPRRELLGLRAHVRFLFSPRTVQNRHLRVLFFSYCTVSIPLPVHFKWEVGVRLRIESTSPGCALPQRR
jgi:hypothetical protein